MLGKMKDLLRHRQSGFTLIEMMVVIVIISIIASVAIPSFSSFFDRYRLRGAADALFGDLQAARMEAIRNNSTVYVNFATGANWCYGMKLGSSCDCTKPASDADYCSLKLVNAQTNTGVTMASNAFTADPTIDPLQGLVSPAGIVTFQSTAGTQAQVGLSLLGMVSICTPSGSNSAGYSSC